MDNDRPIIIKKMKPAHGAGHGSSSWKVAYADFVTAMMAFFLVMWILGLTDATKKAIAAYFNDPVGLRKSHGASEGKLNITTGSSSGRPSVAAARAAANKDRENARFSEAKQEIEKKLANSAEFKTLKDFVNVQVT